MSDAPSNVRCRIIAVSMLMAFILYLDRICLGEIVKSASFKGDLALSKEEIGRILAAFFFTYAIFQVPAGWASDRWGGEMGRLPVVQNRNQNDKPGRDHNTDGFSIWLAGGGIKRGHVHGATDDFGLFAVENVVHHYDYLATVMHCFGLDAGKLIYKRNGRSETIVDGQGGKVIEDILA